MNTSTENKTPAQAKGAVDAIKLLTADHNEVHALFQQYLKLAAKRTTSGKGDDREELAEQICDMLTVHASIEEEIFYPAARAAGVDSDLLDEAEVEHSTCKELIEQIRTMSADDDLYDAKVTVLGEYVDHHVKEEQDELFPKCRKSSMDLEAIGAQMSERTEALTAVTS